jgi:hypothetical protein
MPSRPQQVLKTDELIAKPLNLPGTLAPDPHFSATTPLSCDVSRGIAITSDNKYCTALMQHIRFTVNSLFTPTAS